MKTFSLTPRLLAERALNKLAQSPIWRRYFDDSFSFADWVEKQVETDTPISACIVHDSFGLEAGRRLVAKKSCGFIYDSVEYPDYSGRPSILGQRFAMDQAGLSLVMAHERRIIAMADVVLTGTPSVATWYQRYPEIVPPRIVRNCVDYHSDTPDTRLRAACGIDTNVTILLFPNNIYPNSGFELLLQTLAELDPSIHLAVMSKIPPVMKKGIRHVLRQKTLAGRIHFLDRFHPADLIAFRSGADLSILPLDPEIPSYGTSLPNRFFESVMSRTPIVSTPLPHICQIIGEYECGICAPTATKDGLKKAILEALEKHSTLKEGIKRAAEALNWEHEEKAFLEAVAPVLPPNKGGRIIYISNKVLSTNQRTCRHLRSLVQLGYAVEVYCRKSPLKDLRWPGIAYHEAPAGLLTY